MKSLLKYPILVIGVTFFALFIFDEHTKKWWDTYTNRFKPNVCRDALERAQKMGPKSWSLECVDQRLKISSEFDLSQIKEEDKKRMSYRELANQLTEFAKVSNPETMQRIKNIVYTLETEMSTIHAYTSGEAIVKLQSLKDDKTIAFHIHASVKVKETLK